MDVLGFADSQKESFKNEKGQEEFQRFYSVIRRELDSMNEMHTDPDGDRDWELKVFTDNIVLGYPIWEGHLDHAEPEIGSAVFDIARYQLGMAREGYFVRGGLSIGALFMDTYLAYGPALLEAYELEHQTARDPRIVISSVARKLLNKHFTFYAHPEQAPQNRMFLLDSDGQIFVHYLAECFEHIDERCVADRESLGIHKQHIEKGLAEFEANPRVWAKYSWLAKYHDYTLREWAEEANLDKDLNIDRKLHRNAPVKLCPFLVPNKASKFSACA